MSGTTLDDLARLCRALSDADQEVEYAEERLEAAKERARILREETGPNIMQEIGVSEIKLESGQKVSLKQDVFSQVNKDDKPKIYRWLDDNGFGGLIKTTVQVNFSRGELEKAKGFVLALRKKEYDCGLNQDVHAQTMKAFLREQIANGSNIPLDLFGARPVWQMKIK